MSSNNEQFLNKYDSPANLSPMPLPVLALKVYYGWEISVGILMCDYIIMWILQV